MIGMLLAYSYQFRTKPLEHALDVHGTLRFSTTHASPLCAAADTCLLQMLLQYNLPVRHEISPHLRQVEHMMSVPRWHLVRVWEPSSTARHNNQAACGRDYTRTTRKKRNPPHWYYWWIRAIMACSENCLVSPVGPLSPREAAEHKRLPCGIPCGIRTCTCWSV